MDLARRSVEVILAGQIRGRGERRLPNFEQYQYAWLRNGAFVADEPWVERWGEPPSPLLWSHAMYLRLHHALRDRR